MYLLKDLLHAKGVVVLIRSFCDAGGKSSDDSGYVILVCHSAPLDIWTELETTWKQVLRKFGVSALHTTDLMTKPRRGEYAHWDDDRARSFIGLLTSALRGDGQNIKGTACGVATGGYNQASKLRSLPALEEICLGYCFWSVGDFFHSGDLSFIFDQGDKFRHFADKLWEKHKHGAVMGRLVEIDSVVSRCSPGVQTCDLAAWHARTHWIRRPSEFPIQSMLDIVEPEHGAVHYHNSKRFELDDLQMFDFGRLMNSL